MTEITTTTQILGNQMTNTTTHTNRTHQGVAITATTNTTSRTKVSIQFMQRPNTKRKQPNTKL